MSVYEQNDKDILYDMNFKFPYEEVYNQLTVNEQCNQNSEQQSLPKQQQQQSYSNVQLNISISCDLQISNIDEINSMIQNLQKQLHQFQNCKNISISHEIQEINNQNIQFYQQQQQLQQEQNQSQSQLLYQNQQQTQYDQNYCFENKQLQSNQIHQQYSNNLSYQQKQNNLYYQQDIQDINNNICFTNEIYDQNQNNIYISKLNKQILINNQPNDNEFQAHQQMWSFNESTKQITQQSTNITNDLNFSLNESEQFNQIENNQNLTQNDQQIECMFGESSLYNSNIEDLEINNEQCLFNYQQDLFQNDADQYCDQDGQQLQNNSIYEPHTNNYAVEINQESSTNTNLQCELNQEQIEKLPRQTNGNQQTNQSQNPKKIRKAIQNNSTTKKQKNNSKQPNQKNNNPYQTQDSKKKKNNSKETHNVLSLMIGYLYSRFQKFDIKILLNDKTKKNLYNLNIIINEIHDQLGELKYQQFCYRTIQYLKQYARNSPSIEALLMQKYVHSFELIMRNPKAKINDIKDLLKSIKQKITQQPQYIQQQQ